MAAALGTVGSKPLKLSRTANVFETPFGTCLGVLLAQPTKSDGDIDKHTYDLVYCNGDVSLLADNLNAIIKIIAANEIPIKIGLPTTLLTLPATAAVLTYEERNTAFHDRAVNIVSCCLNYLAVAEPKSLFFVERIVFVCDSYQTLNLYKKVIKKALTAYLVNETNPTVPSTRTSAMETVETAQLNERDAGKCASFTNVDMTHDKVALQQTHDQKSQHHSSHRQQYQRQHHDSHHSNSGSHHHQQGHQTILPKCSAHDYISHTLKPNDKTAYRAAGVVLTRTNKATGQVEVLLGRDSRKNGELSLLGGKVDSLLDESVYHTAVREFHEETGQVLSQTLIDAILHTLLFVDVKTLSTESSERINRRNAEDGVTPSVGVLTEGFDQLSVKVTSSAASLPSATSASAPTEVSPVPQVVWVAEGKYALYILPVECVTVENIGIDLYACTDDITAQLASFQSTPQFVASPDCHKEMSTVQWWALERLQTGSNREFTRFTNKVRHSTVFQRWLRKHGVGTASTGNANTVVVTPTVDEASLLETTEKDLKHSAEHANDSVSAVSLALSGFAISGAGNGGYSMCNLK